MTDQKTKVEQFAALHRKGDPVILCNIWDPGSAKVVAAAGAKAIATGSHGVAVAMGFKDGENTPLDLVLDNCRRIAGAVELPVTLDFEGGYAVDPKGLKANIARVVEAGAIGINFEDQVIGGQGLHDVATQAARVAAVRQAADASGVGLFINARCDVFLKADRASHGATQLAELLVRAKAYADAGGDGLFAPGLVDPGLIGELTAKSPLPVNILMMQGAPDIAALRALGVARISFGASPYREAMRPSTRRRGRRSLPDGGSSRSASLAVRQQSGDVGTLISTPQTVSAGTALSWLRGSRRRRRGNVLSGARGGADIDENSLVGLRRPACHRHGAARPGPRGPGSSPGWDGG